MKDGRRSIVAGFADGYRVLRDAAGWRPANFGLLARGVYDRHRNRRAGYTDRDHLLAAAGWLERAQDATDDGGFAGRYSLRLGWSSSYPETTGYIVPTLIRLAAATGERRFHERARRAIDFLLSVQLESGAFPGMEVAHNRTEPSIFNSAQIVCGLRAWHAETRDERALAAATRACDWLVAQQDADGAWRKFLYGDDVYTYIAHAACWIAELGADLGRQDYLDAARRNLEWVLRHHDARTGWFDLCGFSPEQHRLRTGATHTIAYTIWGVLMLSRILGHEQGMRAARAASLGVARRLELARWLPGELDHAWRGSTEHACLTGNAQMALIWLELHRLDSDPALVSAACKAIDLVKAAQPMESGDPGILGGIPGSDPVWGEYISLRIPNWSAKFFIDALLAKQAALQDLAVPCASAEGLPHGVPDTLPEPVSPGGQARPRVVLYASPGTRKVREMLTGWSGWQFRPAAVVVSREPQRTLSERLAEKLRNDGLAWVLRRALPNGSRTPGQVTVETVGSEPEDVAGYCRALGIDVVEVGALDTPEALATVKALEPDLAVHAGAGILRKALLEIPRLGTVNAHMGVLPVYRGMNVAEWSRLAGDTVGCTVHLIDEGIDTGDILYCRTAPVGGARSVAELRDAVNRVQIEALGEVVRYAVSTNALPPRHAHAAAQGRQYFTMHPDLKDLLQKALAS